MKFDRKHPDRGFLYDRVQFHLMERAFAERWESRNLKKHNGDMLYDILGDDPTLRDRYVAASVIQWLGTNVGFGFLTGVMHESGYYIGGREASHLDNREPLITEMKQAHYNGEAAQCTFDLSQPT